jgi:hypothetical protein
MRLSRTLFVSGIGLLLSLGSVSAMTFAQDASPEATPHGPSEGYPVAVHEGTCDELVSEPAWQLDDAVAIGVGDDGVDQDDVIGPEVGATVVGSAGAIDSTLDDLAGGSYVVAVHASPDNFDTVIACGQVAGVKTEGKIVVALVPVGKSTFAGVAIVDEDSAGVLDLGEDQAQVTVYGFEQRLADPADPATPTA